jgi:signal transduction histidine kinase/CheY-like chemotaxis protein
VAALTIWFIQRQVRLLSADIPGASDSRQKILLVSRALAKLNEAELIGTAIQRNKNGSTNNETFSAYSRMIREVKRDMDSLLHPASPRREQQVKEVQALLDKKITNMKALATLHLGPSPADFYDRSLHTLARIRDTTPPRPDVAMRREISVDSVYIQPPRRGFWSFLRPRPAPTLQVTTSERVVLDTLPAGNRVIQDADTALLAIQSAWDEYQQEVRAYQEEMHRREVAALRDGQLLSGQIKRVLTELEEEEIRSTLARVDERTSITRQLTRTVATVATVACLLVILLLTLVFNDISRGQRYRKALEESNRYARKLLDGREKLMLTVTHDIKSPLNSITGYVELLDNTPLAERQHYFLNNMKQSAAHILQLLNNLLDFSRLEAGKMEVDAIRYIPRRLLSEVADSFMPQATRKGLELTTIISPSLDRERVGDPIKVRQIVANLLSNAIKYTRSGRVLLDAGEKGEMIRVVISDTGDGMTADEQQLVFEEFTRLDALHNNGAEGSGLGLTITRKLVELLGGTIHLQSAPGQGSVFTVLLPATDAAPSIDAPPTSARVLIIDDDPLQLEMISEFLRRNGVSCETLDRPDRVMEVLESSHFDLLITDIQMPGRDGFQLLAEIRSAAREETRALPVIAQSGTGDISRDDYARAGFSDYLAKPYSPRRLLDCIARITGNAPPSPVDAPSQEKKEPYNLDAIRLFADNDEQATRDIVHSFTRDCRVNFQLLEERVGRGEHALARQLAHKMLPMFRQFAIDAVTPDLILLESESTDETLAHQSALRVIERGRAIIDLIEREQG